MFIATRETRSRGFRRHLSLTPMPWTESGLAAPLLSGGSSLQFAHSGIRRRAPVTQAAEPQL